jgi:hypothetical protein
MTSASAVALSLGHCCSKVWRHCYATMHVNCDFTSNHCTTMRSNLQNNDISHDSCLPTRKNLAPPPTHGYARANKAFFLTATSEEHVMRETIESRRNGMEKWGCLSRDSITDIHCKVFCLAKQYKQHAITTSQLSRTMNLVTVLDIWSNNTSNIWSNGLNFCRMKQRSNKIRSWSINTQAIQPYRTGVFLTSSWNSRKLCVVEQPGYQACHVGPSSVDIDVCSAVSRTIIMLIRVLWTGEVQSLSEGNSFETIWLTCNYSRPSVSDSLWKATACSKKLGPSHVHRKWKLSTVRVTLLPNKIALWSLSSY